MGGPYTILGRIGSGGMAEVYLGKAKGAAGFEKQVAIKLILPAYTEDQQLTAMLIEEARIATLLNHVNVVQVLDLGKSDDRYFIVMEYIDGADLDSILRSAGQAGIQLPVELACLICRQVLAGLAFVHERRDEKDQPLNLVHRDVSPPNILISRAGEVKLADFGIAKVADRKILTEAGTVRGKPGFMSPEQVYGEKLDQRSDLYSLGVMLHEMLTGQALFPGRSQIDLLRTESQPPIPPPSRHNEKIPLSLDRVVLRALEHSRKDRFENARAFDRALDEAMQASALKASPADLEDWLRRAMPRRKLESLPQAGESLTLQTPPAPDSPATAAIASGTPSRREVYGPKARRAWGSRWALVGLLLGVMAVAGILFATMKSPGPEEAQPAPVTAPEPVPHQPVETPEPVVETPEAPPEEPAPKPKPPPRGQGTLFLNSNPWAKIIIDGKDTGFTTPTVKGLRLIAGRHRITLINPERELTLEVELVIKRGETLKRFFDLKRDGVQH